ncbi:hypothetical protein STRIP9103_06433 [Streptomyces ipomoeae 91-03]|uniref:Uncharacterized protein n=1 Tax=Streptomyces ipomoeae 91-03 TaxID=698759 RepID=L1KUX2_9ACTN|nr:hypothetical protein STRIP9103_06433 [Streptomyces ipomoeae 91-03]
MTGFQQLGGNRQLKSRRPPDSRRSATPHHFYRNGKVKTSAPPLVRSP